MKISRNFLEELKCLFPHYQNSLKRALEDLIQKIIKCDLNSAKGIDWLRIANRHFGDFHNKLVDSIEGLVIKSFKTDCLGLYDESCIVLHSNSLISV